MHAFHVLEIYPRVGLMRGGEADPLLATMDACRIGWGRVRGVEPRARRGRCRAARERRRTAAPRHAADRVRDGVARSRWAARWGDAGRLGLPALGMGMRDADTAPGRAPRCFDRGGARDRERGIVTAMDVDPATVARWRANLHGEVDAPSSTVPWPPSRRRATRRALHPDGRSRGAPRCALAGQAHGCRPRRDGPRVVAGTNARVHRAQVRRRHGGPGDRRPGAPQPGDVRRPARSRRHVAPGGRAITCPPSAVRHRRRQRRHARPVRRSPQGRRRQRAAGRGARRESLVYSAGQTVCCGRTAAEVARRAAAIGQDVAQLEATGLAGSPAQIVDKLGRFADAVILPDVPAGPRPARPGSPGADRGRGHVPGALSPDAPTGNPVPVLLVHSFL